MLHDANKRKQKRNDIPASQWQKFIHTRNMIAPNKNILRAENGIQNHIDILLHNKILSYQIKKAWYVDNISGKAINLDGEIVEDIVTIDERINELKERNPNEGLEKSPRMIKMLENKLRIVYKLDVNYNYWEVERMFMKLIEQEIYLKIKNFSKVTNYPLELPHWIKRQIENDYKN